MNTVVIVGRVGRDAEVRYFESGKVKANFSVAVNRWDSKQNPKWQIGLILMFGINRLNLRENM